MATRAFDTAASSSRGRFLAQLADPALAIANPRFDAIWLWGIPLISLFAFYLIIATIGMAVPERSFDAAVPLFLFANVITYAHLMAVFPRAYLNPDVFAAHRRRLTIVPVVLLAGMALSPAIFAIAVIVAFYWDVHHSAMQNFGLARIYHMKAGNDPHTLRGTDLALNWALYVGPIFAGASYVQHVQKLEGLDGTALSALATMPGFLIADHAPLAFAAMMVWAGCIGFAVLRYRQAIRAGHKLSAHKLAVMGVSGIVSLLAWGFAPPLIAFASINIHHALQYFAIVWVKEGHRISGAIGIKGAGALAALLIATGILGVAYMWAGTLDIRLLMVPFIACSLLHFWYDGFVWSVRRKAV